MTASEDTGKAGYRPSDIPRSSLQKTLNLPIGNADVMPVEMAKWERLKGRVDRLETRWSINWLSTGISASASVALSAVIAAITIPTGGHSGIDPMVRVALLIGAGAAAILAAAFLAFFALERSGRTSEGADIVEEMKTEEVAWQQREASD